MAVQVCVGRAGTGKTAMCLREIRERLCRNAVVGPRLIFLVPEQAAFQMERALIETPDLPGYHRCDVLSFRRLARRVLNEAGLGAATARPMGPMGRLMAVKLLLGRHEHELTVLKGPCTRGGGLLNHLTRVLDEWLQEELEPQELDRLADAAAGEGEDPRTIGRLRDLRILYTAYREFLADGRLDPAQELAVAEERLDQVPWLRDAEVWVDGFAGFTALERRMLVRLAALARSTVVTLLIDAESAVLEQAAAPSRFGLFSRTERTLVTLRADVQAAGLEWLPPIRLQPASPPRFAVEALRQLERNVFRSAAGDAVAGPAPPPEASPVRIVAAANRRVEVDAAVAEIQRLIRERRLRYRDIAIIVRDLEPYHDLLSAALSAHKIPFFIDRRRSTAHHPLVELLRMLGAIVQHNFRTEDVRLLLKTGLTPLTDAEADALENYVIAHGITGAEAWLSGERWRYRRLFTHQTLEEELSDEEKVALDRIDDCRRRLTEPLREWAALGAPGTAPTGREWTSRLTGLLQSLRAGETLERWAEQAVAAGETNEADVHRQVWTDATALLEDFGAALGDTPLTAAEFAGVLDAAMAEFTLGLAPPTLDQVLVGSIERSRHPELSAVLLLGFNDGLFPLTPAEDVLLTDRERERLEQRRPPVGVTRQQRILDEKMLAYIALTRPSRTLWISYAQADEEGKKLLPSPFLKDVRRALPGLEVEDREDPIAKRAMWPIGRVRELGARLALEMQSRPEDPAQDRDVRQQWNALYERARQAETYAYDLRPILASLAYANEVALAPAEAAALRPESMRFSASRIETFAQCPFRHFAQYTLSLNPRVEFVIEAVDFGLLHHKILEELIAELITEGKGLGDLSQEDLRDRLDRLSKHWTPRLLDEAMLDRSRNVFLVDRSNRHLAEAAARLRKMAALGSFRPGAVEWTFGMRAHPHNRQPPAEALTIVTPKNRTIHVCGRVDRVDLLELEQEVLGVIIDYKRGAEKKMPLWKVYHGIDVQLLTYMLALLQRGKTPAGRPITPVAAFYVPLKSLRQSLKGPRDGERREIPAELKARGILHLDAATRLDADLQEKRKSIAYQVALTTKGALAYENRSDAYAADDLSTVVEFARRKIGELADRILDGEIAVRPYRKSTWLVCSMCDFRPVCRFDGDINEPNDIADPGREVLLSQMRQAVGIAPADAPAARDRGSFRRGAP